MAPPTHKPRTVPRELGQDLAALQGFTGLPLSETLVSLTWMSWDAVESFGNTSTKLPSSPNG